MSYIKQSFIFKLFFFVRVFGKRWENKKMRYYLDDYSKNYTDYENKAFADQALDTFIGITSGGYLDLRSAYQRMLDYGLCEEYEVGDYLANILREFADENRISIQDIDYVSLVADKCAYIMKDYIRNITDYELYVETFANFLDSQIILYEDNIKDFVEHLENLDKEDLEKIKDKFNEDNVLNERFKEHLSDYGFDLNEILRDCINSYSNSQNTEKVKRQR